MLAGLRAEWVRLNMHDTSLGKLGRQTKKVDNKSSFLYNTRIDDKELDMKYTLITKSGRVMQFYIKSLAECYQVSYGGIIVTEEVLSDETVEA